MTSRVYLSGSYLSICYNFILWCRVDLCLPGRYFDELRRHNYTTPTSYLELLQLYTGLLIEQRRELQVCRRFKYLYYVMLHKTLKISPLHYFNFISRQSRCKRYTSGYLKLQDTNRVVEQLKVDLINMQPVLLQSSKDTAAV